MSPQGPIFFLFQFGICALAGKLTIVLSLKRSATMHLYLHLTLGLKFDFIAADSTADFDDLRLGGVGFGPKVAAVEIQC